MNMNMLMQQAQKMQKEMEKAKKELEEKIFEIKSAGGGIVIVIKGSKEVLSIQVDDELIDKDEKEMLQDMIVVAMNEAIKKVTEEEEKILSKQASGMRMPGLF